MDAFINGYDIKDGRQFFIIEATPDAVESVLEDFRWYTIIPLEEQMLQVYGEDQPVTEVEVVGLLRRKSELSTVAVRKNNFCCGGTAKVHIQGGHLYLDSAGTLFFKRKRCNPVYYEMNEKFSKFEKKTFKEIVGVDLPAGSTLRDYAFSEKKQNAWEMHEVAKGAEITKRLEGKSGSDLLSAEELAEVLKHTIASRFDVTVSRAPGTRKGNFDFIEVEFPIYGEEWHQANKRLIGRYAQYRLAADKAFLKYGVPIGCLKIYAAKRQREYISFMFCLKDALLAMGEHQG